MADQNVKSVEFKLDPVKFGEMYNKVDEMDRKIEDLYNMHTNGGCIQVRLIKQGHVGMWVLGCIVTTAITSWLSWITVIVHKLEAMVAGMAASLGG
jgi:hypothetical protein